MDMLWPEIKNAIEELSYGKGVRISRACGVDPNEISLDIGLFFAADLLERASQRRSTI